jgi:AraC family transcriptional regulator
MITNVTIRPMPVSGSCNYAPAWRICWPALETSSSVELPEAEASALGSESYGSEGLPLSSEGRGWSGMSAALLNHRKAVIPWRGSPSGVGMCVDLRGNGSLVTRRTTGIEDRRISSRDTIWLTPPDVQEGEIDIDADITDILHIHLPLGRFSSAGLDLSAAKSGIGALRYETAFEDPLLAEIANAIASELRAETCAGDLLIDALTASMTARLIQKHTRASIVRSFSTVTSEGLDRRRLSRVLDHIEANLEGKLSIDSMSAIACLSRYHFSRTFKKAVGQSPHQYVSGRRLERAKALLLNEDRSLVDIALALSFSSQANFTRAFTKAMGQAPGHFRERNSIRHSLSPSLNRRTDWERAKSLY